MKIYGIHWDHKKQRSRVARAATRIPQTNFHAQIYINVHKYEDSLGFSRKKVSGLPVSTKIPPADFRTQIYMNAYTYEDSLYALGSRQKNIEGCLFPNKNRSLTYTHTCMYICMYACIRRVRKKTVEGVRSAMMIACLICVMLFCPRCVGGEGVIGASMCMYLNSSPFLFLSLPLSRFLNVCARCWTRIARLTCMMRFCPRCVEGIRVGRRGMWLSLLFSPSLSLPFSLSLTVWEWGVFPPTPPPLSFSSLSVSLCFARSECVSVTRRATDTHSLT